MTVGVQQGVRANVESSAAILFRKTGGIVAWAGYLFLLAPMLIVVPMSFSGSQEFQFPPRVLSLTLYRQFFSDPSWWGAALQSFYVAVFTMGLTLLLAVPATYALARVNFRGRRALSLLFMSPVMVPVIVLALGFYLYFSVTGILGTTLALVLAHTVMVTPFMVISVSAGLRHVDPSFERVATIMGATRSTIFFRVVLPQIFPSVAVGAFFAFLISFDEVVAAYFITGAQTVTLPVKMYSSIRWEVSPIISAVATLLTVFSFLACLALAALRKREATSRGNE